MENVSLKPMTLEDFSAFSADSDHLYELIQGVVVDVSPGLTTNATLVMWLDRKVYPFCVSHHIPCHTTGGQGAFLIGEHVLAPEFAFKTTPMIDAYPDPEPPLWAVEIISHTDEPLHIRSKRNITIAAGILYWEVYPVKQSVDVYAPGQPVHTVGSEGTLDGGSVLPGFSLAVADLFAGLTTGR
jgi:Uma2 family endonuclease